MNLTEYFEKDYCRYHCKIKNKIKNDYEFVQPCYSCDECDKDDCDYYNFLEEIDYSICNICPLKEAIWQIEQNFEIKYKY